MRIRYSRYAGEGITYQHDIICLIFIFNIQHAT